MTEGNSRLGENQRRAFYLEFRAAVLWTAGIALALGGGAAVLLPEFRLELLLPDQTEYASAYSDSIFGEITPGTNGAEVIRRLGEPLQITAELSDKTVVERPWSDRDAIESQARRIWWDYSRPGPAYDSYNVRSVQMSGDEKVLGVVREYYQD